MNFVIDASMAAAWLLPEEFSDTAETMIASILEPSPVAVLVRDPQHSGNGGAAWTDWRRRGSPRHGTFAAPADR
jgi:hypothetical protein